MAEVHTQKIREEEKLLPPALPLLMLVYKAAGIVLVLNKHCVIA